MLTVTIEQIISFQSIDQFNEVTGLNYEDLDDDALFTIMAQWHCPGDHETNTYDADDVDSPFLGYQYKNPNEFSETYLLSRYENGLIIGLSRIITVQNAA